MSAHVHGEDAILGTAHGRKDLAEFLRRVGVADPEAVLDGEDPLLEWRGGGPEVWNTNDDTSRPGGD
ncbi:hypothetical protein ACN20G_37250 (plasmid) [Streptomyces sp. BI20]|uniref:hypothetical protein n=1 Tax=Streptomyces sp. BI20 TaxID=3403460 RepID=UPI003C76B637